MHFQLIRALDISPKYAQKSVNHPLSNGSQSPSGEHHNTDSNDTEILYKDLYENAPKIVTRKVKGFYQQLRCWLNAPLLALFFLIPWLSVSDRQAVLFDLSAQQFYIFDLVLWPQDGFLLALVLMLAAFGLFAVTALHGRIWCGFSCPQTVWTQIFIYFEQLCEGDRNQRLALDQAPASAQKLIRRSAKHSLWLGFSALTGFTFISYFYGAEALAQDLMATRVDLSSWTWLGLFTGLTYLNAGFMREQICKHVCPYARFQSVMIDAHSKVVHYQVKRGEPRGGVEKNKAHLKVGNDQDAVKTSSTQSGDCVDCSWCVQVCPAGIDIRDGRQYECIDCGLCIDACDNVMKKLNKPLGLIGFSKDSTNSKNYSPRLLGYSLVIALLTGVFLGYLHQRAPLELSVIRDRGAALFQDRGDYIENIYTLNIGNKSQQPDTFTISLDESSVYRIKGRRHIELLAGEKLRLPLRVRIAKDQWQKLQDKSQSQQKEIVFKLTSQSKTELTNQHSSWFIGP